MSPGKKNTRASVGRHENTGNKKKRVHVSEGHRAEDTEGLDFVMNKKYSSNLGRAVFEVLVGLKCYALSNFRVLLLVRMEMQLSPLVIGICGERR